MISVQKSVLTSLDGADPELYPHLGYLLQDLREMGTSARTIVELIKDLLPQYTDPPRLLDLGCGKGAVSIAVAQQLGIRVTAIDAYPPFIDQAKKQTKLFSIAARCTFKVGDLRRSLHQFKNFDIILLGSIGTVLGPVGQTLQRVRTCLKPQGYVLLADAYLPDDHNLASGGYLKKTAYIREISDNDYTIIRVMVTDKQTLSESNRQIYQKIENRARELMIRYPEKRMVFDAYLQNQREENTVLESGIECATYLLKSDR